MSNVKKIQAPPPQSSGILGTPPVLDFITKNVQFLHHFFYMSVEQQVTLHSSFVASTSPVHIGIHNYAVDRLAKNRGKDIKLLDTKLSVAKGAYSHMFD